MLKILVLIFLVFGCRAKRLYEPEGLTKLSEKELIERAKKRILATDETLFKDTLGNIIPREALQNYSQEKFAADRYVNVEGTIIEVVLRQSTEADKVLAKKIEKAWAEGEDAKGEDIAVLDVNCSKVKEMLEEVYRKDQETRKGSSIPDPGIDQENQQMVVSIIEKCGFPFAEIHGNTSVQAVFLVLQHAGKNLREKYFPLVKESAEKGDLRWSTVALMEDRMLMDSGEKQKYGSQVTKNRETDKWELYPVEDPANVNKRRSEIGLGPIEEYLSRWDIKFHSTANHPE